MSEELVLGFRPEELDGSYPVLMGDEPAGCLHPPFSGDLTAESAETEAGVPEHWAGAARSERILLLDILGKLARRLTATPAVLSGDLLGANLSPAQALAGPAADAPLVLQFEPEERELL